MVLKNFDNKKLLEELCFLKKRIVQNRKRNETTMFVCLFVYMAAHQFNWYGVYIRSVK